MTDKIYTIPYKARKYFQCGCKKGACVCWLDKYIKQQHSVQGVAAMKLISNAATAEELVSYEELEKGFGPERNV